VSKRVSFQSGSWWQLELLPRIRLQMLGSGLGLGIGWLPWWVHIWLWLRPEAPPAPPVPTGDRWYVCNDDDCAWVGRLDETVHPKHEIDWVLCPDCHETLTWFEPHEFIPQNPKFDPERFAAKLCHECGLPDLHEMHAPQHSEKP
jgi:hypothetical protein